MLLLCVVFGLSASPRMAPRGGGLPHPLHSPQAPPEIGRHTAPDPTFHERRRHVLLAAAGSALSALTPAPAPATVVGVPEGLLVWKAASSSVSGSCSAIDARAAFGPKFINYLSRFLLTYDRPSRQLWRARAAEIPLAWTRKQVSDARITQLREYSGAVEKALCSFTPPSGKWAEPITSQDAVRIRQLLTLLRSRYGARPDALRQLALLFSLLPPGVQPTDSIEQLAAEQENRRASGIVVIDGGSFVLSEAGLAAGLPAPALPLPAAPLVRQLPEARALRSLIVIGYI